jgi:predicted glutamine amidotransferase
MCRLYGFRANEPTKVECTLVHAQNALLIQSEGDQEGKTHSDGWGIAGYDNGHQQVERRNTAAFDDIHFSVAAERIYSQTVIAHVRKATVGVSSLENTHPFTYGVWTFAHNGFLAGFEQLQPWLQRNTEPQFLEARRGTTDSEAAFLWLLSRMWKEGIEPYRRCQDGPALVKLMGQSIQQLARHCEQASPEKQSVLNFLLTDGASLFASRWNHSLYWVKRHDVHDCEICGIPHVHHSAEVNYRAVVVASEPISSEAWHEVDDHCLLWVSPDVELTMHSIC